MPFHPLGRGLFLAALIAASPALAQDKAGAFDFYVLSLSWTPTYCAVEDDPDPRSCDRPARGFMVHGFWPEYESGYPQDCPTSEPLWLDRRVFDRVADIVPSLGFAGYQWRKHGVCSGLSQSGYFGLLRRAYDSLRIPAALNNPPADSGTSPGKIEEAFIAANPGLTASAIAVTCRRGMLREVRICMTRTLGYRACAEIDRDSCPLTAISVPSGR